MICASAFSAEFFVATNGSNLASGSITNPWSIDRVFTNSHPSGVSAGDTIWFRGGTYNTTSGDAVGFQCNVLGASGNPITLRNYSNEVVIINGKNPDRTPLTFGGGYIKFWGFEVTADTGITGYADGLDLATLHDAEIINCVVHDTLGVGVGWLDNAYNVNIYGLISYYNGRQTNTANHGYTIYGQNAAGRSRKYIRNTATFMEWGNYSIHLYGQSDNSHDITVDSWAGLQNVAFSGQFGNIQPGIVLTNNFLYISTNAQAGGTVGANFGYAGFGNGTVNLDLRGNVIITKSTTANEIYFQSPTTTPTISGNIFFGDVNPSSFSSTYTNNQWYSAGSTGPVSVVRIHPNAHEPGRANVAVWNQTRASSVSTTLDGIGLTSGQTFYIRDLQNYKTRIATNVYSSGSSYSLAMSLTNVSAPIVLPADRSYPVHTDREVGLFLIEPSQVITAPGALQSISASAVNAGSVVKL